MNRIRLVAAVLTIAFLLAALTSQARSETTKVDKDRQYILYGLLIGGALGAIIDDDSSSVFALAAVGGIAGYVIAGTDRHNGLLPGKVRGDLNGGLLGAAGRNGSFNESDFSRRKQKSAANLNLFSYSMRF